MTHTHLEKPPDPVGRSSRTEVCRLKRRGQAVRGLRAVPSGEWCQKTLKPVDSYLYVHIICIYVCIYTYIYTDIYTYTYTYTYAYTYTYTYIYTYIYIYIYTYTYSYSGIPGIVKHRASTQQRQLGPGRAGCSRLVHCPRSILSTWVGHGPLGPLNSPGHLVHSHLVLGQLCHLVQLVLGHFATWPGAGGPRVFDQDTATKWLSLVHILAWPREFAL